MYTGGRLTDFYVTYSYVSNMTEEKKFFLRIYVTARTRNNRKRVGP